MRRKVGDRRHLVDRIDLNYLTPQVKHTLFDMEEDIKEHFIGRPKTNDTQQQLENIVKEWIHIFVKEGTLSYEAEDSFIEYFKAHITMY